MALIPQIRVILPVNNEITQTFSIEQGTNIIRTDSNRFNAIFKVIRTYILSIL